MSRGRLAAAALLLATLCVAAYVPVLSAGFVNYDDGDYVSGNPHVRSGLSAEGVRWAFTTFHASNWHPLTWLSHMLDVQVFGLRPWGHHLTSVLLHALSSALLLVFLARATGAPRRSFLVAAIFALHPLHVESVAWIAERKDVLSGLLFVATLLAWRAYAARPGAGRYLAAAGLVGLGLMAKPMLVTLPLVLLLVDVWPLGRLDAAGDDPRARRRAALRLAAEKLPLLALSAAASILTLQAQEKAIAQSWALPPATRIANALVSLAGYVGKALRPVDLAVFYPHPEGSLLAPAPLAVAVALALAAAGAIVARRRAPFVAVGLAWFAGMLVPVSGIVQVGSQAMADRYTYLPLIGLSIVLVWGAERLATPFVPGRLARRIGLAAIAAIVAPLALLTFRQAGYWKDTATLFTHTLEATAGSPTALNILGVELQRAGDLEGATRRFREALALDPFDAESNFNLGMALFASGRREEAEPHFGFILSLRPSDPKWRNNIGVVQALRGDLPGAIAAFRDALWLRPDYVGARANLANALGKSGRTDEAVAEYREVIRQDPWRTGAYSSLGELLRTSGRAAEAEEVYRRGTEADPGFVEGYFSLAALADERGETDRAIELMRRVVAIAPRLAQGHNNLGALLAKGGRFSEAREHFEAALALDPGSADARANLERLDAEGKRP